MTSASAPDKARLLAALIEQINADLDAMVSTHKATHEGAVHEESRAENDKDTRAIESTYLARGLAQRAAELGTAKSQLTQLELREFSQSTPVALSALVRLRDEDDEHDQWYFLAPAGGGLRLTRDGFEVAIITPGSPLGDRILGKSLDDEIVLETRTGTRCWTIDEVL